MMLSYSHAGGEREGFSRTSNYDLFWLMGFGNVLCHVSTIKDGRESRKRCRSPTNSHGGGAGEEQEESRFFSQGDDNNNKWMIRSSSELVIVFFSYQSFGKSHVQGWTQACCC